MNNRLRTNKAPQVIEKSKSGDVTWRRSANGKDIISVGGKRNKQLKRLAQLEGTTPAATLRGILEATCNAAVPTGKHDNRKLVPYIVMLPEHHAAFFRDLNTILTDFAYYNVASLAENVINYGPGEAIEQSDAWNFDTEEERLAACDAIEAACQRLIQADAEKVVASC